MILTASLLMCSSKASFPLHADNIIIQKIISGTININVPFNPNKLIAQVAIIGPNDDPKLPPKENTLIPFPLLFLSEILLTSLAACG